jgi:hypothetical protein
MRTTAQDLNTLPQISQIIHWCVRKRGYAASEAPLQRVQATSTLIHGLQIA